MIHVFCSLNLTVCVWIFRIVLRFSLSKYDQKFVVNLHFLFSGRHLNVSDCHSPALCSRFGIYGEWAFFGKWEAFWVDSFNQVRALLMQKLWIVFVYSFLAFFFSKWHDIGEWNQWSTDFTFHCFQVCSRCDCFCKRCGLNCCHISIHMGLVWEDFLLFLTRWLNF